jgi:hypothetical protein
MLKGLAFEFYLEAMLDHLHMTVCIVARVILSCVLRFTFIVASNARHVTSLIRGFGWGGEVQWHAAGCRPGRYT